MNLKLDNTKGKFCIYLKAKSSNFVLNFCITFVFSFTHLYTRKCRKVLSLTKEMLKNSRSNQEENNISEF